MPSRFALVLMLLTIHIEVAGADAVEDPRDRAVATGRIELRAGMQVLLASGAEFSDETPASALALGAGYYLADSVVVGVGGAIGMLRANGESQEAYGMIGLHRRLPIIRAFAGLRAGYYREEARGSDYIFDDHGPRVAIELGMRLAVPRHLDASVFAEPMLVLSGIISGSVHADRNASYPAWPASLAVALVVPVSF